MIAEDVVHDKTLMEPLIERYQGREREALLPMLHDAQKIFGWLSGGVLDIVAKTLRVPLADVHGVVEFYTMFYNEPTERRIIRVCEDVACRSKGADEIIALLMEADPGENQSTYVPGQLRIERVQCLGLCDHAPAALFEDFPAGDLTPDRAITSLSGDLQSPQLNIYGKPLLGLADIGSIDPMSLKDYENSGGFRVLRDVISMDPGELIDHVDKLGIMGRGGAMFPVGRKWRFTRDALTSPKYVVVNADESEPGTFKDRYIIEGNPFSLIEAAIIAAFAIGADIGWIFLRGEYPLCAQLLTNAIEKSRAAGYLGRQILGGNFNFDIELRIGAGAYICGEETALFEAIEGKRGFPRIKPPFPTSHGLFGQPTAINNVETLVMILAALRIGLDAWRSIGTEQSPGTKLFCLSGHVNKPGVYEVPFGTTLRELLELAGGVPGNKGIKAILLGGAAGAFVGPETLDMPLTYEHAREKNLPLGSGVIMVFDHGTDMKRVLYDISHFFAHESCGKCFPCQIGTQRQMEILERNYHDPASGQDNKLALEDIGQAMTETSLCGLGQTASAAILSALRLWPELVA